ncbi:MAG: hypothetical protein MZV49_09445 [Rhodopseudomonas palustris]|nr:hypothetical protein [Rhodopseudomonas palustris]
MTHPLFDKHRATLDGALAAIATRGYWTPYPEQASPKVYGERRQRGRQAGGRTRCSASSFDLGQPGVTGWLAGDRSPYGVDARRAVPGVRRRGAGRRRRRPRCRPGRSSASTAAPACAWRSSTRLNKASFEIAHAVMLHHRPGLR